jgi:hypothetical protein
MLFRVMMTHYGPKDNETAIAYFVSAPSEREMIKGIDQKATFGRWRDRAAECAPVDEDDDSDKDQDDDDFEDDDFDAAIEDEDDDSNRPSIYMDPDDITDEMRAQIAALGLTLDERQFGADITGDYWALLEYYHGDGFEEVDGDTAYYGCKRYAWEEVPEVDHAVLRSILGERFIDLTEVVDAA